MLMSPTLVVHVVAIEQCGNVYHLDNMYIAVWYAMHGVNIQPTKGEEKGNVERNCQVV
jgi:hypothetical protein